MKLTKGMLLQLINEEYSRVNGKQPKKLQEGLKGVDDSLKKVKLDSLIRFASAYAILRGNAQSALKKLIDADYVGIDPESVEVIEQYLGGCNEELDIAIADWYDANMGPNYRDDYPHMGVPD